MSDTCLCEDSHLQRLVVIKALKPGVEKHRLMDELSALSSIRSKYVVQVLDIIYDGADIVGLVEEYIDGPELKPLPKSIDTQTALRALYPMFSGIAEVHEQGRLHRDLKPDNMKFDSSGNLKLFDFGLAKLTSNASTQRLFFTKGYAAPEIFVPDMSGNHTFTTAVDVFAMGVSSFWLFNGGNIPAKLCQIPPILPCADFAMLGIPLPPNLSGLLNSTLSQFPQNRPSADDLRAAIARELLFDRHRMLITHNNQTHILSSASRTVTLAVNKDSVAIKYNGYDFVVTSVTGQVRRNNKPMMVGDKLAGASVIVLGDPNGYRTSITADVSHPEVM